MPSDQEMDRIYSTAPEVCTSFMWLASSSYICYIMTTAKPLCNSLKTAGMAFFIAFADDQYTEDIQSN